MTHLRLVEEEPRTAGGPFETELPPAARLPRGRHGIPADLVAAHQRRRLLTAAGEALAEHGYARLTAEHVSERAGVSSSTFYKHFGNLWDCLLAAYGDAGERLRLEIEAGCAEETDPQTRLAGAIDAGLAFLATNPALAQLLGRQPPLEAAALAGARRDLVGRLATMLRRGRDPSDETVRPAGLEERLIDASLSFVASNVSAYAGDGDLTGLAAELIELLAGPRRAAAAR